MARSKGIVYLIHLDPPVHHAKHYAGWTPDLTTRMELHQAGKGARLTQVAVERGSALELVRTWRNRGRGFERKLKARSLCEHCPFCAAAARDRKRERDKASRQRRREAAAQ